MANEQAAFGATVVLAQVFADIDQTPYAWSVPD
jgi:hypothetical protein